MASVSVCCPSCSATEGVMRNGKSTAGHQRYLCSHCRKTWQLTFTYAASQPGTHQKIIDMAMNGVGCRAHYDPLANRVQRSITNMAIECGLATESRSGNLSITRATRALKFLAELGLITYQTEYDPQIGCNIPTDITFTPALFSALDVSEMAVVAARRSRVEWENLQRKKQQLKPLEMDELIAKAWRFVRERFRSYQAERKSHGRKRDTARRDASRQRHDIETRVRQQLTREYATGRFRGDKEALKREVERRVQERMLLSRGNNYTRLATAPL
ncbi:plasmid replication initiator RepA [Klebsiella pneumoniae]